MSKELVDWIEKASYEQMLERNRFGPLGDPIFKGDIGILFADSMRNKANKLSNADKVRISKELGL